MLDEETRKNNIPAVIFRMRPSGIALITMDFRTLMAQEFNWVYGEDWSVGITIAKDLTLDDVEDPILLPEQFLHKDTAKNDIIEFQLLAWDDLKFRVDILIYNTLYLNHKYVFLNSTSVEIRDPNRGTFGENNAFAAVIYDEYFLSLPFN